MKGSTLKPDFKNQLTTILQLPDGKWSFQVGCPSYRFVVDTWEEMIAQYTSCLKDPVKWFDYNKVEAGNKQLKPVQ
mgnify:CR=1 FL=1|tara:strand:+ start:9236 stop:9463 length:228 start_codon:yes stop_codon:yes gene_type:complete